mmetsp:Transcript_31226/g.71411  ORF Transcript_31226/g.71411 Transcript_31226/m.71411 type:complete len:81 (-) Transcript_31226:875-1117(-)
MIMLIYHISKKKGVGDTQTAERNKKESHHGRGGVGPELKVSSKNNGRKEDRSQRLGPQRSIVCKAIHVIEQLIQKSSKND